MKAFLINPKAETEDQFITEVNISDTKDVKMKLNEIYGLLNVNLIEAVGLKTGDVIYVDEEGLLKSEDELFERGFFRFSENNAYYTPRSFTGKGLVVGIGKHGEDTPPKITLEELKKIVHQLSEERQKLLAFQSTYK